MVPYLVVMAVAALVTAATVPLVSRLAVRIGAVKAPRERDVHTRPMPDIGGLAMLFGVIAGVAVSGLVGGLRPVLESPTRLAGVLAAAVVVYVVGFIDDLRDISAPAKTAGVVLAGSILSLTGLTIVFFRVPFFDFAVLSPDLSALVTVLWVVGMANAVNLIDGLDGLAAGVTGIAAGAFFLYGHRLVDVGTLDPASVGPLVAIITAGVCLGFLWHNFHPAKIIMGDGGALLLGVLMASSTIAVGGQSDDPYSGQAWFFFAPILLPLVILAVPIVDTALAIVRRTIRRSGVSVADQGHLHHRLIRLGHGHRRAVLIMWAWTALLSGFVLFPVYTGRGDAIVPIGIAAIVLTLFTMFAPRIDGRSTDPVDVSAEPTSAPVPPEDATPGVIPDVIPDVMAEGDARSTESTIAVPVASSLEHPVTHEAPVVARVVRRRGRG